MEGFGRVGAIFATQSSGSHFDGLDDFVVPGTATEIPGECLFDLISGWRLFVLQKRDRCHEYAWGAIAALRGIEIGHGGLQRVQLIGFLQALDGLDVLARQLGGQKQARKNRSTIHQYRAGPTLAQLAPVLGPSESKLLAQDLEQGVMGRKGEGPGLTVDGQFEGCDLLRHGSLVDAASKAGSGVLRQRRLG